MGFFDFLWGGEQACPTCTRPGAKVRGDKIRCRNPQCKHYDPSLDPGLTPETLAQQASARADRHASASSDPAPHSTAPSSGSFDPETGRLDVRYRNFRGEEKTFLGDARTIKKGKKHLSLRVAPTGRRIALALDRIINRPEVEAAAPKRVPTVHEARILRYHTTRGSTSPLYEKIRRNYPDWR